ncbi:MAG TPA: leucine--tRNA ligase [Candidatus Paceibacterota bacterium]|jgi:leucyl-tRNA synthetase
MSEYDHKRIERKWQKKWNEQKDYIVTEDPKRKKSYILVEFPYPSGEGLHVGHARSWTAFDILSRKRRAEGENVLFPIGWDAFGLPTENYAVKTGIHPKEVTKKNTDNFRSQMKLLGLSFDWSREINTTDPSYYKWTQWIFLQLYKNNLAYKARMPINWCLSCKIGLANEEVIDGKCERCGGETEKREKEQWMLAITKYADRLDKDLDDVDYWDRIKIQQRNWIGRSEGVEISFPVKDTIETIAVFTTRLDTLFGATYMVLAPEHPLLNKLEAKIENWDEVVRYIEQSRKKTELERATEGKEKTGVELKGVQAINPGSKEEIPIFIADYVLGHYGTGAIMAVPAHDERDFAFAKKFGLPIVQVISGDEPPFIGKGKLVRSGKFDGLESDAAKEKIAKAVTGRSKTTYKLRDWVFSRQRYWGEPIPVVNCEKCGWVPVPESELPVELPDVKKFQPSDTGESPLAAVSEWVNTVCPHCAGPAKRETDTMPNWAGSSWYYLRYTDPHNNEILASTEKLKHWTPVDWYNGGMEHTTLHLLYSRFWHKFLFDIGVVPTPEPYAKRTSHGLILAEGGEKMSKSKGNVVNPDAVVETLGADTLRLYEMFIGPFDQAINWSSDNIVGVRRFLERVWRLSTRIKDIAEPSEVISLLHQTIKKVGDDIELLKFNTAVSQLMILLNALEKEEQVSRTTFGVFIRLLAPFAPHVTEELWEGLGNTESVHREPWPQYDAAKVGHGLITIAVQVNGKLRGSLQVDVDTPEAAIRKSAEALENVSKWLAEKRVVNVIFVPGRLMNFVVK